MCEIRLYTSHLVAPEGMDVGLQANPHLFPLRSLPGSQGELSLRAGNSVVPHRSNSLGGGHHLMIFFSDAPSVVSL